MNEEVTVTLTLNDRDEALALYGQRDQNLRMIKDALGVRLVARGEEIHIHGEPATVELAERVFVQLRGLLQKHEILTAEHVRTVLAVVTRGPERPIANHVIAVPGSGRAVRPRTDGQGFYSHAMQTNDIIFAIGPAGTGKTYLAVGHAVNLLRQGVIKRIVLVRPAVEAGEKLGFLPGDIAAKINPYLRPIIDALGDMMDPEQVKRYMENDIIEIAPLAFMRGRTLSQAVVILDEGQNTTVPQMKMFLTRMGPGSKIIVTGDVTQVDLPDRTRSGLLDAIGRLKDLDHIAIVYLTENDIVRHPLVQAIVKAYEDKPKRRKGGE